MNTKPSCALLRRADQRVEPWRNGGGSTRTVAIDPPDGSLQHGFRWRVSIADVAQDGPFSVLPGIDRSLWLLAGNGLALECGMAVTVLRERLQRLDFVGEAPIVARLLDGPTRDLNLMSARGVVDAVAVTARLTPDRPFTPAGSWWLESPQRLVLVLRGACTIRIDAAGAPYRLDEHDALRVDGSGAASVGALDGPCELLAIGIGPVRR